MSIVSMIELLNAIERSAIVMENNRKRTLMEKKCEDIGKQGMREDKGKFF